MFSFYQGVPPQPFVHPASFSGIYSEDDFVNNMAQRAPHDFPFAHARAHPFAPQRGHHRYHHHPHHNNRYPGGPYRGPFSPASWDNLWNGFGPASGGSHPAFSSPNHRGAAFSPEELACFLQQESHQRAHERRQEAIARQRGLAREREAQYQRALAEAVALEQQVRAAREAHIRAANAARAQERQRRDEEVLLALLAQLGLAAASVQSAVDVSQASRETPSVQLTPSAAPAASASAPSEPSMPTDRKGKGKAADAPAEITAPSPSPAPANIPTLQEELEARIRTETDPDVQASLVLLYSDLFDVREPSQPVAGPSGHKHVSFQVPVSGPSPSASGSASTVPIQVEETIDTDTTAPSTIATPIVDAAEEHGGANAPFPLPSLAQIQEVEDTFRQLEGAFEFPAQLDFVDRPRSRSPSPSPSSDGHSDTESASLAYTANNTPVRAYEHALNELLTKLDAVESNGDVEVRGRRREVVKEVERALEAMERRIEESRERSRERERARWGSVSSQVSDASVTVTPYDVHSSDNVDEVEVAVAAEEVPVEVPVEVEEPAAASDVEDASVVSEHPALQVEVPEEVAEATNEDPESTVASPLVDNAEPEAKPLALGIPDSGADLTAPYLSHPSIFSDPSSPVDEDEDDLDGAFDAALPSIHSSASQVVLPAVKTVAEPSSDFEEDVTEQDNAGVVSQDPHSASETEPASASQNPSEQAEAEGSDIVPPPTHPPVGIPEAISREESTATDATFVTAGADTTTPPEPTPAPMPGSPSSTSSGSAGEEAFLLSSTPLADEHQPKPTQGVVLRGCWGRCGRVGDHREGGAGGGEERQ